MENEIAIARFNKLLDQKLQESDPPEADAALPADCRELLNVAERLRQADFSTDSRVKGALWEKLLEMQRQQTRKHPVRKSDAELDEDDLYQATGGVSPPPEEEPDQN